LFISHTGKLDGASICLQLLINYLKEDYEIEVLVPDNGGFVDELINMMIKTHCAPSTRITWRTIPWLIRLIIDNGFDLVYGNNFSSGSRNALIAAKFTRKPFVWHIREMISKHSRKRKTLFLKFADEIIADSIACAQSIEGHVTRKKIHAVHNGIILDDFQTENDAARNFVINTLNITQDYIIIANMGLICARKGQEYV